MANESSSDIKYPEMDYFMNESISDVVFVIEGQKFPALKQILGLKSKVFRAMFFGNFEESESKEVVIKDTTFEAFKTLIRFIYCDKLVLSDESDLKLIRDVCEIADRYEVFRLFDKIGDIFDIQIEFENFEQICGIAFDFKINELVPKVKEFLENNFSTIINKDISRFKQIDDLSHNTLLEVMYNHMKKMGQVQLKTENSVVTYYNSCRNYY